MKSRRGVIRDFSESWRWEDGKGQAEKLKVEVEVVNQ